MILVDDELVELKRFPDKTLSFRLVPDQELDTHTIVWNYDGDEECMAIWNIVHHIRSLIHKVEIHLVLPYIPNARMDRVKHDNEVFTLKWFAEFINLLGFASVAVLDAHSNVSLALIDRVVAYDSKCNVDTILRRYLSDIAKGLLFCYPDEGAAKRNSELFEREYVFGIKHRNWETGQIERLEITTPERVSGRNILIIDDICSKGGTFTHTAKALKAAGAKDIFLYIAHCENTILQGPVLTDGLISHVFTTGSIFRGTHEKITVLE